MEEFEKFYNKALRFLSYRPRSEKEIRDKLISKRVSEKIIKEVIKKLKAQKFINDEEFVGWWVEQRINFKPRSLRLIKMELRQKGVHQEIIEKIISNDQFLISNDLDRARKLVEKKMERFRNKFGMTRQEIYQKLGRFLASKGFDWETIKKSIDEVVKKGV